VLNDVLTRQRYWKKNCLMGDVLKAVEGTKSCTLSWFTKGHACTALESLAGTLQLSGLFHSTASLVLAMQALVLYT